MQDTGIMIQQKLNYFRYISSISTHTQSQGRPVLMSFLEKDGRQRKKGRLKLALSSVSADDTDCVHMQSEGFLQIFCNALFHGCLKVYSLNADHFDYTHCSSELKTSVVCDNSNQTTDAADV